jgi:glycosyltransferase involved in cell wall biosynthesis
MIEPFETRSYQAADAVTAVSKFSADSVQRAAGIKHVYPIHNWVDVNRFQPAPVVRPQNLRPFRLLFVGKPSRSKGADLLAPIMQQLGQDFELRVAGRIDPAQSAHYPANIHVLGWLNEEQLIRAYQNCDGLLLPSRSEGFGYAALEAMACGKPVIGSNATALPEVVAHGVTGLLCTPGDITAFVAACRYLAHNPEEHRQMGEAARQRALEQFSETIAMTQYLELIDRRTQH